jgi:2',3'-cyclic-nucleotide 2'-phosphodiesterase (5'-nucleotidase family)
VRRRISFFLLVVAARLAFGAAPEGARAVVVLVGDQHSAYERTAQFVARIDRLRAENPGLPVAILINGDSMEFGNAIARRTAGAIDFAMFAALAERGPTILNFGNHEPEFHDVPETVRRIEETGVNVISSLIDRATGRPIARESVTLKLGSLDAVVAGIATADLQTYRVPVRPTLAPPEPVAWGRAHLPRLLATAPVKIVLSHAGLPVDRQLLSVVTDGTLFAGAHNHLRFVHREGRTVYVHTGSWTEFASIAWLREENGQTRWEIEQVAVSASDPADPKLAGLIQETFAKELTPADATVVGRLPRALGAQEAGRFSAAMVRTAAKADVAFISNTTFGAGLPAGSVTRFAFDACVRFDGTIFLGEFDGAQVEGWMRRANQGPDTPFAERGGETLFADAAGPSQPGRRYRVAVTDWIARNAMRYLNVDPSAFKESPDLRLKAIVAAALGR